MKEQFSMSFEIEELADSVIDAMTDLSYIRETGVKVGYMVSNKEKTSRGKTIYADCEKVKPKNRKFIPYDFLITVYAPNVKLLTKNQMKALLYHELLHIGVEVDKNGEVKHYIVPHDVEDFRKITDRFGLDWCEVGADIDDITKGEAR